MAAVDDTTGPRVSVRLDDENDRYHRQTLISWWDQDRLRAARVLVVGAGAIGNELVKNLALAGIGTVVVIDLDDVENSNLSRCVFFRPEDEGRPKSEVVCQRAADLNGDVRFIPLVGDIRHELGLGDFADFDVVLGGLDNREARLHVNQACWKTSTPWVDGAIEGLMGTMRVFVPPESACYECTMSPHDHELLALRRGCALLDREEMLAGKVPTTGTSGSVVAALQVQELIKLLHADRMTDSFAGQGVAFNGLTHDSYVVTYPRHDECLSHDTYDLRRPSAARQPSRSARCSSAGAKCSTTPTLCSSSSATSCSPPRAGRATAPTVINRPVTQVRHRRGAVPTMRRGAPTRRAPRPRAARASELSAGDLELPSNDVVTARGGMQRVHFLVGPPLTATETAIAHELIDAALMIDDIPLEVRESIYDHVFASDDIEVGGVLVGTVDEAGRLRCTA